MPEEILFKTEEPRPRAEIAATLREAADQIESGSVHLQRGADEEDVAVPETARFEIELERLTDPETDEQRYALEYELGWTK